MSEWGGAVFRCGGDGAGDEVCLPAESRCNGTAECEGGEDESVAECGCLPNEFRCGNLCVDALRRCDRVADCPGGEDEMDCETFVCPWQHMKCKNHFCVPEQAMCDFVDDCGDGSDELDCTFRSCWESEFRCDNGECIRPGYICDKVKDCKDGSDELLCAPEDFVICGDGTKVHRHYWCDGWPECTWDFKDELNCNKSCDGPDDFLCPSGRCIRKANKCDSQCDCGWQGAPPGMQWSHEPGGAPATCADEMDCGEYYDDAKGVRVCRQGKTLSCMVPVAGGMDMEEGLSDEEREAEEVAAEAMAAVGRERCIRPQFICDTVNDCQNGHSLSDEFGCPYWNHSDWLLMGVDPGVEFFTCSDNRSLPMGLRCDLKWDCVGGEDEDDCPEPMPCRPPRTRDKDTFQCANGQCISAKYRCDLQFQCWDKSDEIGCEDYPCPRNFRKCLNGQCVREDFWCDYHVDCADASDETDCGWPKECRDDEFRCRSGQCVPMSSRCYMSGQQRFGCADRSHLVGCEDWKCDEAAFKCRNGPCLNSSLVCDGRVDCPWSWTDEDGCPFSCSQMERRCECRDVAINCTGLGLETLPADIEVQMTKFYMADNFLNYTLNEETFSKLHRLSYLDLSNNSLTHIPPLAFKSLWKLLLLNLKDNKITTLLNSTFYRLPNLRTLHLQGNNINTIESMAFYGLSSLTTLDLSHQRITNISQGAFLGLRSLVSLDLSHNNLQYLMDGSLNGLPNLLFLDLSGNSIKMVGRNVFRSVSSLKKLKTDEFRFCCLAKHIPECLPPPDEFSSCEDLMSNLVLRVCVWVLGAVATVGNALVITWRMIYKNTNQVHSFLITNLAIGDFFMGAYLLVIASVDAHYRGVYIIHDAAWRSSELCQLAGFISTFSSELSVYTLTVITLDRFLVIIFPFRVRRLEMPKTRLIMAGGWIGAAFLSGLPLMQIQYFQNFYGRSGVCLALHITPEKPNGWEYSVFVFLFLNLASFSIIALGYVWMYVVARTTRQAVVAVQCNHHSDQNHRQPQTPQQTPEQRRAESSMARRMTLLVATDAACWMPIILLGVASLGGVTVPPQVFAWVAVFVLPLNAAINPVLYTLSTAPFLGPARRGIRSFKRSFKRSISTDQRRSQYEDRRLCANNCSRCDFHSQVGNNFYSENVKLKVNPLEDDITAGDEQEESNPNNDQLFALTKRMDINEGCRNPCIIETAVSMRGEIIPLKRLSPDKGNLRNKTRRK
ncbi:G-protein coupled receptor GRL101-like isoform X2 [Ischnura elegans]|uniref:G-protein coupled receptor GRL101-like isoform X2 n=1 Tax=Ischnura elegans TaxID=197161 RepID=UPI001ED89724|nr:G-protein coupled receptor GRL101-like isoform X2 [Ischnura elegans]